MRAFLNSRLTEQVASFGWTMRRYFRDRERPAMVRDTARLLLKPGDGGMCLPPGSYDLDADGVTYLGLAAPFRAPLLPQVITRAFPGTTPTHAVAMLRAGGTQTTTPADGFVLQDTDIWSVPDAS